MVNITILFKSGKEITFPVEDFTTKTFNGELCGYSFEGATLKDSSPLFININEVAVIMQKGV